MPSIHAFHGIRYDLGHVGALSNVIAPDPALINGLPSAESAAIQKALYEQHPSNFVRLIKNREEPGDGSESDRFDRAAHFLRSWQRQGVMQSESHAAIYAYRHLAERGSRDSLRNGFIAKVRLDDVTAWPHFDGTASEAEVAELVELTTACQANLVPILTVFPDVSGEARRQLDEAIRGVTPIETDNQGVHQMWTITGTPAITQLRSAVDSKPAFAIGGSAALAAGVVRREQVFAAEGELAADHPAQFGMMLCVPVGEEDWSMLEEGMLVESLVESPLLCGLVVSPL